MWVFDCDDSDNKNHFVMNCTFSVSDQEVLLVVLPRVQLSAIEANK